MVMVMPALEALYTIALKGKMATGNESPEVFAVSRDDPTWKVKRILLGIPDARQSRLIKEWETRSTAAMKSILRENARTTLIYYSMPLGSKGSQFEWQLVDADLEPRVYDGKTTSWAYRAT